MVYEQEGRTNEAIIEIQKAIDLSDGIYGLGSLGHVYASAGLRSDAQRMLQSIAEQSSRTYISPQQLAIIHVGLAKKIARSTNSKRLTTNALFRLHFSASIPV
jgi:hypothetical protein